MYSRNFTVDFEIGRLATFRMRISTITNWAYGITVALTALSGASFIMSSHSAVEERRAVEEHLALETLAEELALGSEIRSDDARLYVMPRRRPSPASVSC